MNPELHIQMIWAQEQDGGIGLQGKLPWHLSEDLKNFKKITQGMPVIMGLNTWISLPLKPLPKRRNIVLSPDRLDVVESYPSIEDCIQTLREEYVPSVFIIGGAMVYGQFYPYATDLHITLVSTKTEGIDAWFPVSLDQIKSDFKMIEDRPLSEIARYTHWIKR